MLPGTTFEPEQARSLSLDPKKALDKTIGLGLSPIRIGIRWNQVERKKETYDWQVYDDVLYTLKDVPIVLCIGLKVPRWPEFFIPDWLDIPPKEKYIFREDNNKLKQHLFAFFQKVINRYKKYKNIRWIQVENEPFLRSGSLKWRISYKFLNEEVAFIKKITNKPIILTAQGLPTTGIIAEYIKGRNAYKKKLIELADIIGLHVYPRFEHISLFDRPKTFKASKIAWNYLRNLYQYVIKQGKECWCTELQAEPWETNSYNQLDPKGNKSCNPEMVKIYLNKLKDIGFKTVLIWGSEFHVACEEKGNKEWVNIFKNPWEHD